MAENGKGGTNPGFSVSYDSGTNTFTPSGPTTPSWAPGNTPGSGGTNPAGLNDSENNKDSKNNINLNEEAAKNEAAKKNAEKSNEKNKAPSKDYSKGYDYSDQKFFSFIDKLGAKIFSKDQKSVEESSRDHLPSEVVAEADKAYTRAREEGKTEEEAQQAAREVLGSKISPVTLLKNAVEFKGKNTGPTYDPSISARVNTNKTIAKGSSEMGPSAPANTSAPATSETNAPSVSETLGGATNTGITYRGGTVTTPSGTSVTDSGTGGSISSSITPPSRDESSIGLGVYNNDRANYDQDNWNRGMESESSSLVSDEECKSFAKRAFMENSEPFKKVRILIVKKC